MSWGDYARLAQDAVIDCHGQTIEGVTAHGEAVSFAGTWEYDDWEADDGKFVRIFTRETSVERRLTAGSWVVIEGVEYGVLTGSATRRDGGVEFRGERRC